MHQRPNDEPKTACWTEQLIVGVEYEEEGECGGGGDKPEDPDKPQDDSTTKQYLKCIADEGQAGSIQNLTNRPSDSLLWGGLTGNDFSTMINIGLDTNRLWNIGQGLLSNPTPLNLVNLTVKILSDRVTVGAAKAAVGENGAGTAFVKEWVRPAFGTTIVGRGLSGALNVFGRLKLIWDAGATLRGIYVCAPVAIKPKQG